MQIQTWIEQNILFTPATWGILNIKKKGGLSLAPHKMGLVTAEELRGIEDDNIDSYIPLID